MGNAEKPLFRTQFHRVRKICRALLARAVLVLHSCAVIHVTVTCLKETQYYGLYAVCFPVFAVELIFILYCNHGLEFNRFCPAFLCYLVACVPPLWILELRCHGQTASNVTTGVQTDTYAVDTLFAANNVTISTTGNITAMLADVGVTSLLEQSMMFVIIICRWLLPRGRIDRHSMSQLLIIYSAISADILDFCEIFRLPDVQNDVTFHRVVLGVWSWSLLQFTVVATTSSPATPPRPLSTDPHQRVKEINSADRAEAVSILMVFFMQDGPFLSARLYAIFKLNVLDYLIIFFALKNMLTLMLGLYRVLVLCRCVEKEGDDLITAQELAAIQQPPDKMADTRQNKRKMRKQ